MDKTKKEVGWDTTGKTKPWLLATAIELLREGEHGIKSRALALEMSTYRRNDKGKTLPESGKFADRLLAWMIAQQVAQEKPLRKVRTKGQVHRAYRPRDRVTGY